MLRNYKLLIAIMGILGLSAQVHADIDSRASKIVQTYCVTCHNENLKTANLLLDQAISGTIKDQPATWEKLLDD